MTDFGFSLREKWDICNIMQESYGREFTINTDYRRQFGRKYREEKGRIEKILNKELVETEEFTELFSPIIENSEKSKTIINDIKDKNIEIPLQSLVSSYIHMMINRLFRTQQRKHELILYDYLFRYYTAKRAQQGEKVVTGTRK